MLLDKYGHLKLADFGTCMRMGQVIHFKYLKKSYLLIYFSLTYYVFSFLI